MKKYGRDFYIRIANEIRANGRTAKKIVEEFSVRYDISVQAIYKNLRKYHLWHSGRKTRSGAGEIDPVFKEHLLKLSKIYLKPVRFKGAVSHMPLETAVEMYTDMCRDEGIDVDLPCVSTIHQHFRRLGISRNQVKQPEKFVRLKTEHSNQAAEFDTSKCRFWFPPKKNNVQWLDPKIDYKNKPERKKRSPSRFVMIDHLSGAFFVWYGYGETIEDNADFFYNAWARKENDEEYPFCGVPEALIMDNDTALRSHALTRLLNHLGVKVPKVKPYNPKGKGAVEGFNAIWERHFEARLMFSPPRSLKELNDWAYRFAMKFQNRKVHSRHGQTRFRKWVEKIPGHLRELPDYDTFKKLLYANPVTRSVDGNGIVKFSNKKYRIDGIINTKVDVTVHPFLYKKNHAVTIQYPSMELNVNNVSPTEVQTFTVLPIGINEDGFEEKSAVKGKEYKAIKDSKRETNLKQVEEKEVDEKKILPFKEKQEDKVIYMPTKGERIKVESIFTFVDVDYKFQDALLEVVDRRRRGLDPWERAHIEKEWKGRKAIKETEIVEMITALKEIAQYRKIGVGNENK